MRGYFDTTFRDALRRVQALNKALTEAGIETKVTVNAAIEYEKDVNNMIKFVLPAPVPKYEASPEPEPEAAADPEPEPEVEPEPAPESLPLPAPVRRRRSQREL